MEVEVAVAVAENVTLASGEEEVRDEVVAFRNRADASSGIKATIDHMLFEAIVGKVGTICRTGKLSSRVLVLYAVSSKLHQRARIVEGRAMQNITTTGVLVEDSLGGTLWRSKLLPPCPLC